MGLISLLLVLFDPFGIIRNYIMKPATDVLFGAYSFYKDKTANSVLSAREVIIRLGIIMFAGSVIIWTAIFMYIAFYYTYMPAIAHMRPVNMQFETCDNRKGPCTFPHAHISLTKNQQLLMVGQPYKVYLNIDMPESPTNLDLGMFMVCAEMRDQSTGLLGQSCRSTMMRYKSSLIRTLTTWVLSPLFVFGLKDETQRLIVELFSNFEDDQLRPVTDVYVEIQSQHIQFYSVTLHIAAHFSGLRYVMFHWPILSASIGVSTNLFFILIVSLLSWYHWSDTTWIKDARDKYVPKMIETYRQSTESSLEILSSKKLQLNLTPESGDSASILDDEELSVLGSQDDVEDLPSDGNESSEPRGVRRRNVEGIKDESAC